MQRPKVGMVLYSREPERLEWHPRKRATEMGARGWKALGPGKESGFCVKCPGKLWEEMTCALKGALRLLSRAWVVKVEAERRVRPQSARGG